MMNQEQYNLNGFPRLNDDKDEIAGYCTPHTYNLMVKEKWVPLVKEYVVSSGENHTVKEFAEFAFACAGIGGDWLGKEIDEIFLTPTDHGYGRPGNTLVKINPSYYRPAEVDALLGNPAKIASELGWNPTTTFKGLVKKMVEKDLREIGL